MRFWPVLAALYLMAKRAKTFARAHYEPFSAEARALFREAAILEGLPVEWADQAGLHHLLQSESGGWVGIPQGVGGARTDDPGHRELWPRIWKRAREADRSHWVPPGSERSMRNTSCTRGKVNPFGTAYIGLGQLGPGDCGQGWATRAGSVRFMPGGAEGLGIPLAEARGMLGYIADRYDDPDHAWRLYHTKSPAWY